MCLLMLCLCGFKLLLINCHNGMTLLRFILSKFSEHYEHCDNFDLRGLLNITSARHAVKIFCLKGRTSHSIYSNIDNN